MNTNWIDQDTSGRRVRSASRAGLLDDVELGDVRRAPRGAGRSRSSLGMTLLKLTSPGVPDIYQGDELPLLALVDPDNRRPVDWELRRRLLASGEPPAEARPDPPHARPPRAPAGRVRLDVRAGRGGRRTSCAFLRGGEVLVAVAVRGDLSAFQPPSGTWDDVLRTPHLLLAERV